MGSSDSLPEVDLGWINYFNHGYILARGNRTTVVLWFDYYYFFESMGVLPACASHVCSALGGQKECWIPWTGVIGSCELLRGCWELNAGPLQEQPVFLTAEPSLWPQCCYSINNEV